MAPTVHILILAAGSSSRMRGVDKLVQPVGGVPLLRRVTTTALATGAPVAVTLRTDRPDRNAALDGLPVRLVPVPDADRGMSRSVVRGSTAIARNAGKDDGLMILPADMPAFTADALLGLILVFQSNPTLILRGGTDDGRAGHPTIFPRDLWSALASVTGDEGGRSVIKANKSRVQAINLPGQMAVLDLDTPEDWAAWRAVNP